MTEGVGWGIVKEERGHSAATSKTSIFRRPVMIMGIACVALSIWYASNPGKKVVENTQKNEQTAAQELLKRIASEAPVDALDEPSEPIVVQALEGRNTNAFVNVTASPGPALFIQRENGKVICQNTHRCLVPIESSVEVRKQGYRALVLNRDDLYDRRGHSWRVILRRP